MDTDCLHKRLQTREGKAELEKARRLSIASMGALVPESSLRVLVHVAKEETLTSDVYIPVRTTRLSLWTDGRSARFGRRSRALLVVVIRAVKNVYGGARDGAKSRVIA